MRNLDRLAMLTFAILLAPDAKALAQPQLLPELPSNAIVILPGERVVLSADSAVPEVQSRGPAPAGDLAALPAMDNSYETVGHYAMKGPIAPVPGGLVLELISSPNTGARLVAVNGADFPVRYSAVLVLQQHDQHRYVATSICPVQAGRPSIESWANDVAGIAILAVQQVAQGDTACNNGSLLSAAPPSDSPRRACSGQLRGDGPLPLFQVTLVVDANGAVSQQAATWGLSRADIFHSPAIGFDYAMEGDRLTPNARSARVMAAVGLQPRPAAKTADIVLRLNGVEVVRQPWRMFAERMAAPPPAQGPAPAFFYGVIPISPASDPAADLALRRMLGTIGKQPATLEVQIVGDTGGVLADGTYEIGPSTPVNDPGQVSAVLHQAQTAAKTPAQCPLVRPGAG